MTRVTYDDAIDRAVEALDQAVRHGGSPTAVFAAVIIASVFRSSTKNGGKRAVLAAVDAALTDTLNEFGRRLAAEITAVELSADFALDLEQAVVDTMALARENFMRLLYRR